MIFLKAFGLQFGASISEKVKQEFFGTAPLLLLIYDLSTFEE